MKKSAIAMMGALAWGMAAQGQALVAEEGKAGGALAKFPEQLGIGKPADTAQDKQSRGQRLTAEEVADLQSRRRLLRKSLLNPENAWPRRIQLFMRLDDMTGKLAKYADDAPVVLMMDERRKQIVAENRRYSTEMVKAQQEVYALLQTEEQKSCFRIGSAAWAEYAHDDCTLTAKVYSNDYHRCWNLHFRQRNEALQQTAKRLREAAKAE